MHFTIITRCSRPDNLEAVQDSIRNVFGLTEHTYQHILIVDCTGPYKDSDYKQFADKEDKVSYVYSKTGEDKFMASDIDTALIAFNVPNDSYVYILDDDNILHPDFLDVCKEISDEDIIVFKVKGRPAWGRSDIGNAIRHIDWANFITRADAMKRVKVFRSGKKSSEIDGNFFNNAVWVEKCSVKFVDRELAYYNKLKR